MPLLQHIEELRKTLIKIFISILIFFAICLSFSDSLTRIILSTLLEAVGNHQGQVVYLGVLDKLLTSFQLSLWAAVIFSSPLNFYFLWQFIAPGLYPEEIRKIRPFMILSFFLFLVGVSFAHFVAIPSALGFFLGTGPQEILASISLKEYVLLHLKVLVGMGMLFQTPNVLLILSFMGIVSHASLSRKRGILYVGFSILAALLTPPDVVSQILLFVPLVLLFEFGLLLLWMLDKKGANQERA